MTTEQIINFNPNKVCFEVHAKSLGKVIMAIGGQCNTQMYIEDTTPCKHYKESVFRVHYLNNSGIATKKPNTVDCGTTDDTGITTV